jgi:hypothetical protein
VVLDLVSQVLQYLLESHFILLSLVDLSNQLIHLRVAGLDVLTQRFEMRWGALLEEVLEVWLLLVQLILEFPRLQLFSFEL